MDKPRISIVTPTHDMENGEYFLSRLMKSLDAQTFKNFEVIVTNEGKMAENTNRGIKQAKGDIIKILFMDDYFVSPYALDNINNAFKGGWLASGCLHDSALPFDLPVLHNPHYPKWDGDVPIGKNTIGSPSVVAFENNEPLLFDENLSWLLDCELYGRLYERYGEPTLINDLDVAIGVGMHQTTHKLTNEEKWAEHEYITKL